MKLTTSNFNAVLSSTPENKVTNLLDYITHLKEVADQDSYDTPETSINLPKDKKLLDEVLKMSNQVITPELKYHILIGIGGSNLGTKAIYDALLGHFDIVQPQRLPRMIFVDTVDPKYLKALHDFIRENVDHPEQLLVTAVTKSGTTTETIANLEIIQKEFDHTTSRLVLISSESSPLTKLAKEEKYNHLTLPDSTSGRYSVFSAVGLFPLVTVGIDIEMLQKGAQSITDECLNTDLSKNPAARSALTLYHYMKKGHNIHDTFVFHPELESLGRWYRQLMGESIGKRVDLDGQEIHAGMTPTVSVGSTDLHSVGQLYLGGPNDKVTTFVSTNHDITDISVPKELSIPTAVEDIAGKKASSIMHAILKGVQKAYKANNLPFMDAQLETISEYELGQFMQFKMIEMMLLSNLLNVNAFNQPNVESYKEETRKILKELRGSNSIING